jgi:hypothetical protein
MYKEGGINSLEDYVQKARAFAQTNPHREAQEGDAVGLELDNHLPQAQGEDGTVDLEADHQPRTQGEASVLDLQPDHHPQTSRTWRNFLNQIKKKMGFPQNQERDVEAYKLFVDLASPYPDRLGILKFMWMLDGKQASDLLQTKLFDVFDLLYTKKKMCWLWDKRPEGKGSLLEYLSVYVRTAAWYLPWAAVGLFHKIHREAYDANDVKVTYALLCCTAVLESCSISLMGRNTSNEQEKGRLHNGHGSKSGAPCMNVQWLPSSSGNG